MISLSWEGENESGFPMPQERVHVVQSGDCISSIAEREGFFWKTIWDQNARLKAAQYQSNLTEYNNHVTAPNPSAADGEAFRRALAAYVGS